MMTCGSSLGAGMPAGTLRTKIPSSMEAITSSACNEGHSATRNDTNDGTHLCIRWDGHHTREIAELALLHGEGSCWKWRTATAGDGELAHTAVGADIHDNADITLFQARKLKHDRHLVARGVEVHVRPDAVPLGESRWPLRMC